MNTTRLPIHLDFRAEMPIYLQLVEQIRQMVLRGELQQGDQLPTVRQLATELRVSLNTVARAYQLLDEAHLISTQRGRGTYIWDAPSEKAVEEIRRSSFDDLAEQFLSECQQLGYTAPQVVALLAVKVEAGGG
ncbi:MAG TPA: GntR family transcriptional regulator [Anaerolineaceae bacterium]|jgi:GntR family transcriptional regulator|nr:GntR family transcriptional regulator [Anaerolineaceae bacterium]